MRKTFLTSTFWGVILGLAFVGYVVYAAFQPPTSAPPGNNVSPPLNTSSTGQTKAGGLTLNTGGATDALIVANGYLQLALTSGVPAAGDCDASSEYGRMKVDSSNGNLYICVSSGWVTK